MPSLWLPSDPRHRKSAVTSSRAAGRFRWSNTCRQKRRTSASGPSTDPCPAMAERFLFGDRAATTAADCAARSGARAGGQMTQRTSLPLRVQELLPRYERFLTEQVAPLETKLARRKVGTPWAPTLDDQGRMNPTVWEARREGQRRSAAAGLFTPHMPTEVGGLGLTRVETMHVEEYVYRRAGLGLGLATLAWTEGPSPNLVHLPDEGRRRFLDPLMRADITCAFANTEPGAGSDVLAMTTRAERDGDAWVISGTKGWITNAHFCDVAQVVAVTQPRARRPSPAVFVGGAGPGGVPRGPPHPPQVHHGVSRPAG